MRAQTVEPLLTPTNSALVLVDCQPFQLSAMRDAAPGPVVDGMTALAATAGALDIPTVALTLVEEFDGALVAPVAAAAGAAEIIDRVVVDPAQDLTVVRTIRRTGRGALVIAGLWTGGCVTTLALSALDAGHDVVVVTDACADVNWVRHDRALGCLAGAGVVTTTVDALAAEWARVRRPRRGAGRRVRPVPFREVTRTTALVPSA